MKGKNTQSGLDEMQSMRLMKLEGNGFWLTFWVLTAAVVVQCLLGTTLQAIAGELAVLALASIYITVTCLHNGLWAPSTPDRRTNLKTSLIGAAVLGAVLLARALYVSHMQIQTQTALFILAMMAGVFAVGFAVLELMRAFYRKRRDELENQGDQEP